MIGSGVAWVVFSFRFTRPRSDLAQKKRRPLWIVLLLVVAWLAAEAYEAGWFDRPVPVAEGPVRLASWNIANLGGSKDAFEIGVMAETLRDFDLVAVQEVITSPAGADAVARLDDALDRTGAAWDYALSPATSGRGTERYAFFWKPSAVRLVGRPWLDAGLDPLVDREPFLGRFEARASGRTLLLASFHAVPKSKEPALENRLLYRLEADYPDDDLVIAGDFNLDAADEAFDPLRQAGFRAALAGESTTLKMFPSETGETRANPYDNLFYESNTLRPMAVGVADFSARFPTLKAARAVSDHLPVWMEVGFVE